MHRRVFLLGASLACVSGAARAQACFPAPTAAIAQLERAMQARDLAAIRAVVAAHATSGPPRPEAPDELRPFSRAAAAAPERTAILDAYLANARRVAWWRGAAPPSPQDIPSALRTPARLISGLLKIAAIAPHLRERATALAGEAGDYLISASAEARFDGAPFPYWRGREGRLGQLSERAALRLERCGQLQRALRNGWFVIEDAPHEYFFDTGLVGEAHVALYRATQAPRFLDAALRAARWAAAQPLASNWNYNAFLAGFFAELAYISDSALWRDRAVEWVRYGVMPGMIARGPHAGHWVDPHNERIVYRVIMARTLVQVARACHDHGADSATQSELVQSAQTAITALEQQMRAGGGFAAASGMAELYGEIALAQARGIDVRHNDADLRTVILRQLLANAARDRQTPDNGVADAIALWYRS